MNHGVNYGALPKMKPNSLPSGSCKGGEISQKAAEEKGIKKIKSATHNIIVKFNNYVNYINQDKKLFKQ